MTLKLLLPLVAALSIGCAPGDNESKTDTGSKLTVDLEQRLKESQGQWVYVNYWAQWLSLIHI